MPSRVEVPFLAAEKIRSRKESLCGQLSWVKVKYEYKDVFMSL
jgi:hypothetical protein